MTRNAFNCFQGALLFILIGMAKPVTGACHSSVKAMGYRFPVVVKVPQGLYGIPVDRFEAWSVHDGTWRQMAIQVDEKNKDDSYVLESGMPYTGGTDDGLADGNDEISVRGHELGDFFDAKKVPVHIQKRLKGLQRLDICTGSAFAGSFLIGWAPQSQAKMNWKPLFDEHSQTVITNAYRYEFNHKRPMLVGKVFLKSGHKEQPVFEDSTFFMPIVPRLWILPGTRFDESDFDSEIECWRSGPVRSIVAVGARMQKFFSIVKLHLFSELVFYDDFFQIPTQIEMTFDASKFLDYGSGLAYVLRYPSGGAWDVHSNLADLPPTQELGGGPGGSPKETAREYSPNGIFRAWGSRPEGSFLAQVRVDSRAIDAVPPPFIVREPMFDAKPWRDSWKWLRNTKGNLGVYLDISRVHKGTYDFTLDLMLSDRANDVFTDFLPFNWEWVSLTNI